MMCGEGGVPVETSGEDAQGRRKDGETGRKGLTVPVVANKLWAGEFKERG